MENALTSGLVANQLPQFVREDYPKFVTFLEKYYGWMETQGGVTSEIDNLRYGNDIDLSNDTYLDILKRDLLPYFPQEILSNKRLFLKLVAQFYKANGTQDALKFLFRALYNEEIDIYYPKEDIIKTSDGKWVLPLALRIDTTDTNIFNIEKTKLTGQTTKATAIVEKVIKSVDRQLGISYYEAYISNIERLFKTGETVTSTYRDENGNAISVSGRLIGSLSELKIDPLNRGAYYNGYDATTGYPGDPVSIIGGFDVTANNPIGAVANVGVTTSGGVTDIFVTNGGYGFRNQSTDPSTLIFDFKGGFENAPLGTEAKASLTLVDGTIKRTMNVSNRSVSSLNSLHPTINDFYDRTIQTVSTYQSFNVYPMSFVTVSGSGGGYRTKPTVDSFSLYNEDYTDSFLGTTSIIVKGQKYFTCDTDVSGSLEKDNYVRLVISAKSYEEVLRVSSVSGTRIDFYDAFPNDITQSVQIYKINRNIVSDLGALGRIAVSAGGSNYALNDTIIFTGGSGYGANAYVSALHAGNSGIKVVTINNHSSNAFVMGGEGYRKTSLPTLTVRSAAGTGASLSVTEILGDGEELKLATSKIGAVTSLRISSYGYDYSSLPKVSLRNADLTIANVTAGYIFVSNTKIYQGTSNTVTTFKATIDKFDAETSFMRIFDYVGTLDKTLEIISDDGLIRANVTNILYYGDGRAKASAAFENGLIRYPGVYLNSDGQPSSDKKIQDSDRYHNFSYLISSQTDYAKFKKPLNDIVHPLGTKTLVNRIVDNTEMIDETDSFVYLTVTQYGDTFNIRSTANSIVSTNVTANLRATINVGDTIVLMNVRREIANTVNVVSGSNVVTGKTNSVNFINDFTDGDVIYLSTGDTTSVKSVINANCMILTDSLSVTSTTVKVNVISDVVRTINFVNNSTMFADTNFTTSNNYITASIQKVR